MADKFNQQEEYEAFKKLKQEQPKYLRGISQLWEQINVSIYKAADASNDLNKAHKDYVNIGGVFASIFPGTELYFGDVL